MVQFIILGYLPGTDIQIGFDSLVRLAAICAVVYLTALVLKEHRIDGQHTQEAINQKAI
jgi:hypothetical protein